MKNRGTLIGWDVALLAGIILLLILNSKSQEYLVAGLVTVLIFSNCLRNHIAAYKLNGKIY
jgi:uncharacterized membrane protein (GlpM family)